MVWMILFPEFFFYVLSETSDREEDIKACVDTTEMVRPVSTEKMDIIKSTTSSDTQFSSLATGMTLNILPLALIVHKQMEKQKVDLASLRRY